MFLFIVNIIKLINYLFNNNQHTYYKHLNINRIKLWLYIQGICYYLIYILYNNLYKLPKHIHT